MSACAEHRRVANFATRRHASQTRTSNTFQTCSEPIWQRVSHGANPLHDTRQRARDEGFPVHKSKGRPASRRERTGQPNSGCLRSYLGLDRVTGIHGVGKTPLVHMGAMGRDANRDIASRLVKDRPNQKVCLPRGSFPSDASGQPMPRTSSMEPTEKRSKKSSPFGESEMVAQPEPLSTPPACTWPDFFPQGRKSQPSPAYPQTRSNSEFVVQAPRVRRRNRPSSPVRAACGSRCPFPGQDRESRPAPGRRASG